MDVKGLINMYGAVAAALVPLVIGVFHLGEISAHLDDRNQALNQNTEMLDTNQSRIDLITELVAGIELTLDDDVIPRLRKCP